MLATRVCGQAMTAISAAINNAEPETASVLSYKHLDALLLNASKQGGIHVSGSVFSVRCVCGALAGGSRRTRRQEAATLRDQHCLRAITHVERFEHGAHVRLDRALGDIERARDLFVGEAAAEHADDFELPQREAVGIRRRRQVGGRGHEHVAGQHLSGSRRSSRRR